MVKLSITSHPKEVVGLLFFVINILTTRLATADGVPVSPGSPLRALVPLKAGFTEFVSWSGSPHNATFNGFSVEVFKMAALRLPFPLNFTFIPFGNGFSTPSYDDMVQELQQGKVDAIVADLTINKERLKVVDFTQPYVQSALVMVTPFRYGSMGTLWDFLQPFSLQLWVAIVAAFLSTGMVIFILEHKNPDFHKSQLKPRPEEDADTPASSPKRLLNVYWFTSLTVFFAQRESVRTHTGRFVTVLWLLVVLIFTQSYTASLASILSFKQSYPTIQGFKFLLKDSVLIGYQGGSFVKNHLTMLGVKQNRLRSLLSEEQYANALRLGLKNGGVGAIVDELPYIQSFLSTECDFTIVGDQIAYFGGFGFAFAKNSTLTNEMSMAILSLAEDGTLQRLKDYWVGPNQCSLISQATSHMRLWSFGGLFIILAVAYFLCLVWRVLTWQLKSKAVQARIGPMRSVLSLPPSSSSPGAGCMAMSNGVV